MHTFNKDGTNMLNLLKENFAEDISPQSDGTIRMINDDFVFHFEDSTATGAQLIKGISINVTNVDESMRFWQKIGFIKETDNSLTCAGHSIFSL